MSSPRVWPIAGRVLAVESYYLFWSWEAFNQFGLNRGLGYPRVASREEISFWFTVPVFQAGLVLGLLVAFARCGLDRLLLLLNLAVWAKLAVNVGIIGSLVMTGAKPWPGRRPGPAYGSVSSRPDRSPDQDVRIKVSSWVACRTRIATGDDGVK